MTENSAGIGTVTRKMVRDRAVELAVINGRSAKEVSKSDWEQAKRELTGDWHHGDRLEDAQAGASVGTTVNAAKQPAREIRALVAMELNDSEADLARDALDALRVFVGEDADLIHGTRQGGGDLLRGFGRNVPRAGREDEADGIGAGLDRGESVVARGGAANLDPGHDFSAPSPV